MFFFLVYFDPKKFKLTHYRGGAPLRGPRLIYLNVMLPGCCSSDPVVAFLQSAQQTHPDSGFDPRLCFPLPFFLEGVNLGVIQPSCGPWTISTSPWKRRTWRPSTAFLNAGAV